MVGSHDREIGGIGMKLSSLLLSTCSGVAFGVCATFAQAQTTAAAASRPRRRSMKVIVTGSHIERSGYDTPTPVTVEINASEDGTGCSPGRA